MKRSSLFGLITTGAILLLISVCCRGANLTFEWEASPDSTVTGYRLYVMTNATIAPSNILYSFTTAATNYVWTNAVAGKQFWSFCTATNSCCESDPSNVVQFSVPVAPGGLHLKNTIKLTAAFESAEQLGGPFSLLCDLGETDVTYQEPERFFRIKAVIRQ